MLLPFEKTAFRQQLMKNIGVLGAQIANAPFAKSMGKSLSTHMGTGAALGAGAGALHGAVTAEEGQRLDGAVGGALRGGALGATGGAITGATAAGAMRAAKGGMGLAKRLGAGESTRRVVGRIGEQTVQGAGFGGLLGAGTGALTAEEGHRTEGALKGFAGGAATGALGGAVSGGIQGASQVGRLKAMQAAGATRNEAGRALAQAGPQGWWRNVKNSFGAGAPGARAANRIEAMAAPATLAADAAVGAMLLGHGAPPEQQVRTASAYDEERFRMEPLYVTPLVGAGVRSTVDPFLEKVVQKSPEGLLARNPKVRKYLLPTAATMALTIPTVKAIRMLSPSPADTTLKQLDLESLQRDYGKTAACYDTPTR
jgi:hypothetical protein